MTTNRRELLTDELARNCRPEPKDYAIADTRTRGLFLRVQPNGARSWIARRTIAGKHKRQFLGKVSAMTADQARNALRAGRIQSRQRDRKSRLRFETFLARYLSRKRRDWKPSSYRTNCYRLRANCLPAFAGRVMCEITHSEVATWFYDCSRKYPGGANQLLVYMRAMFNAARRWDYLPANHPNPAKGIRRNRCKRRAQLLNQPELKRLLTTLNELRDRWPTQVAAIEMLLFTGCRRGEILTLTWGQVQDDRLLLAKSKTGPRTVILNSAAREIIASQAQRRRPGIDLVFPQQQSLKPFENLDVSWTAVKLQAQLPPTFRLHDLRHTFASHAIMEGISLFMTGRLLGQKRPETTAHYTFLLDDHLLEAAEKVAADLQRAMRGPSPLPPPPAVAPPVAAPSRPSPRRPKWHELVNDPEADRVARAKFDKMLCELLTVGKLQASEDSKICIFPEDLLLVR